MQKIKKIILWAGYTFAAIFFVMSLVNALANGSWIIMLGGTVVAMLFVVFWNILVRLVFKLNGFDKLL